MNVRWLTDEGIDRDALVDDIKTYIDGKHSTLWGKQSSVFEEKGLNEMANWLADVIGDVAAVAVEA